MTGKKQHKVFKQQITYTEERVIADNITPAITPAPHYGILPLSFAQQRLWFLAQFDGVSETYHIPTILCLRGQLDIAAWQQALNTLFSRHEALRTVFVSVDGQPQVRLLASDSGLMLLQYDLRRLPESEAKVEIERLYAKERSTPFDFSRGPLIRTALVQLTDREYYFLLTQHHIISDGWSISVLMHELNELYTAFIEGYSDPLPPLKIQYSDYAVWQRQWLSNERIQAQYDYWRNMLADAPMLLDLPTDRSRPPVQSFSGNSVPIYLDPELTTSLKHLSREQGVTLFMTLMSAWAVVLSRLSDQEDMVIGTLSAGRCYQEVEPLIGLFVNILALRLDISGEQTVSELLTQVRQTALIAQVHQDLPFEQVVEVVQPPRLLTLAHIPLFQVLFTWHNNERTDWKLPRLTVSSVDQDLDIVNYDLELDLFMEGDKIVGYLSYSTALFDQSTIERQVGYLYTVLQSMVVNPQQQVREIDILTPTKRDLLLKTRNTKENSLCIHQLFEQQAAKNPIYEAPQGEIETTLAIIWSEILGIEKISRYDNFFDLGGHSLLLMKMINLALNRGLVLTLDNLFQYPVLAKLAAEIISGLSSQSQNRAITVQSSLIGKESIRSIKNGI
ncbi:hypothetical protein ID855_20840 [Xenorhabdus sp. ZM]|uniref:condensation domain-containing protein n=1 Tax=Xenorhabdus szentirmaii TaxID=290112 RepID=UPI0019B88CAD|nr:condensation domain-containing protein [Xenorhabdus sp. ZM]MBD2807063.1 hypothetical protein [Xenorhabdus sp. ZM]